MEELQYSQHVMESAEFASTLNVFTFFFVTS